MKSKWLFVAICLACVLIISAVAWNFHPNRTYSGNDSAKRFKLNPEELGNGWKEESFVYMDDPVDFFEKMAKISEEATLNANDSNLQNSSENDSQRFRALSSKLQELNVNNGSVQMLTNKMNGTGKKFIEVDTLVFDDNNGAIAYFEYRNLEYGSSSKSSGKEIEGLGDRAIDFSDDPTHHVYIIRVSNAVINFAARRMEKEESMSVAEKIIEKAEK